MLFFREPPPVAFPFFSAGIVFFWFIVRIFCASCLDLVCVCVCVCVCVQLFGAVWTVGWQMIRPVGTLSDTGYLFPQCPPSWFTRWTLHPGVSLFHPSLSLSLSLSLFHLSFLLWFVGLSTFYPFHRILHSFFCSGFRSDFNGIPELPKILSHPIFPSYSYMVIHRSIRFTGPYLMFGFAIWF